MQRETRQCQSCGESFVIDEADFGFYEKMAVPAPTFCPHCRMLRRFVFRNVHHLFRKREATEGREVFSMYPQQVVVKVYELDYWNSDAWDPLTYGRDYDFSRPFFEQFKELLYEVPWPAKSELRMVNSPYSNNAGGFKNCYLCFNGDDFENSAYVITGYLARESFDLFEARHTELSYEGYMIDESFKVFYSVNCEECHEVWFSRNMVGCQNCFGCVNLRNKTYHLFNEKVGKERYDAFMSAFNSGSHEAVEEMKERARGFWTKHPMKYALLINNQNATGEHIERSKNIKFSYGVHEAENVAYSQNISPPASDLYDYTTWGVSVSQMYETLTCGEETSIIKFAWECWPSSTEIEYSAHCRSSSNLFGCVGLNKKKHCIF
ncbi:hypothetical protein HY478_01165, partial [Candidatus Uhrbacteria bacterium]|nr:hypothetical protein [Candidatus Uhrbacteria bacterium]